MAQDRDTTALIVQAAIEEALYKARKAKPIQPCEEGRRYAITVTELEKVYAYFTTFVVNGMGKPS
jgi:hypothetical protein